jgi:hypothetical protein
MLKCSGRHLPQTLLGGAIDYALGQWLTLEVYLKDGQVELDNNLVENAIRPTALGKKNWLFIGDANAGQRSAIIYTIIENCRRHGLDPFAYLRGVLTSLPHMTNRQIPEVTPQAWIKGNCRCNGSHHNVNEQSLHGDLFSAWKTEKPEYVCPF